MNDITYTAEILPIHDVGTSRRTNLHSRWVGLILWTAMNMAYRRGCDCEIGLQKVVHISLTLPFSPTRSPVVMTNAST